MTKMALQRFVRDIATLNINVYNKDLGHRSNSIRKSHIVRTHKHTHTHPTDCSISTTKLVSNKPGSVPTIHGVTGEHEQSL